MLVLGMVKHSKLLIDILQEKNQELVNNGEVLECQIEEFQFGYPKDLVIQTKILDKLDKISALSLNMDGTYNKEIRRYEALKLAILSKALKSNTRSN